MGPANVLALSSHRIAAGPACHAVQAAVDGDGLSKAADKARRSVPAPIHSDFAGRIMTAMREGHINNAERSERVCLPATIRIAARREAAKLILPIRLPVICRFHLCPQERAKAGPYTQRESQSPIVLPQIAARRGSGHLAVAAKANGRMSLPTDCPQGRQDQKEGAERPTLPFVLPMNSDRRKPKEAAKLHLLKGQRVRAASIRKGQE